MSEENTIDEAIKVLNKLDRKIESKTQIANLLSTPEKPIGERNIYNYLNGGAKPDYYRALYIIDRGNEILGEK